VCNDTLIEWMFCLYTFMFLLVCTFICIETFFCSCAKVKLLRKSFAFVQPSFYWPFQLLICRLTLVESSYCLGAIRQLLNIFFASVQSRAYWGLPLLMCKLSFIKGAVCLSAARWLLNISFAYVQSTSLLRFSVACVQARHYWFLPLLVCSSTVIEE